MYLYILNKCQVGLIPFQMLHFSGLFYFLNFQPNIFVRKYRGKQEGGSRRREGGSLLMAAV